MAQGQGSAASGGEADHAGEEEYRGQQEEGCVNIFRTSWCFTLGQMRVDFPWPGLDWLDKRTKKRNCYIPVQSRPVPSAPLPILLGSKLTHRQTPKDLVAKLFGPIRERYASRPGGYTRVLRIEPRKPDQAPSAILELVDGPRDMRFAMTAKTLVREREKDLGMGPITAKNVKKVTRFRKGGMGALKAEVRRIEKEMKEKEEHDKQVD